MCVCVSSDCYICLVCYSCLPPTLKVTQYSEANHMTSGALATSCGLSVFPAMQACTSGQLLKFLIDRCTEVFELPVEE